jgi:DNA polymerase III sliding clamp (beta) subunit (PCNA family)
MKLPEDYAGPREGTTVWSELKILIPATSIRTLLQAFPAEKKKGAVNQLQVQGTFQRIPETPSVVSGMIVFRQPSLAREMASALEDGTFPSYEPLLLSEVSGVRMQVATQALSEAIEKVKSRDGYMVTLHFEPTMQRLIVIETTQEQTISPKREAVEAIMAEGQDIRIGISWRYLQRILASIPTPLVMIESIPPRHYLRITPSGLHNKGLVFSHAIAPAESFH